MKDYDACVDNNQCVSGKCEGIWPGSIFSGTCGPNNGFALGETCELDSSCAKDLWCDGGSFGKCLVI